MAEEEEEVDCNGLNTMHIIAAGMGFTAIEHCRRVSDFGKVTFGLVVIHSVVGSFKYGLHKHCSWLNNVYERTLVVAQACLTPFVTIELYLHYEINPFACRMEMITAIIPMALLAMHKPTDNSIVELCAALNLASLFYLACVQTNQWPIPLAICCYFMYERPVEIEIYLFKVCVFCMLAIACFDVDCLEEYVSK